MQPYPTIKNTTVSNTDVLCLCVGGRGVFIVHLRPMFLYNEFIRNIPFNNMHSVYYVTITVLTFQVNIFIQFTNLLCVRRFFSGTCLAVFVFDGTLQPPQIHRFHIFGRYIQNCYFSSNFDVGLFDCKNIMVVLWYGVVVVAVVRLQTMIYVRYFFLICLFVCFIYFFFFFNQNRY